MAHDKKDLQKAIKLLVSIHEDDNEIKGMAKHLGMGNHNECKGWIANTVRYLMAKRDSGK